MGFSLESNNGNEVLKISQAGYTYSFGYYSSNSWVDEYRLILARFKTVQSGEDKGKFEYVLVNVKEKSEKVLLNQDLIGNSGEASAFGYIVYGNILYYYDKDYNFWSLNIDTLENKFLCKNEYRCGLPHITSDGRFINWQSPRKNDINACMRLDSATGEVIKVFEKKFTPPFSMADHMMICPTNPDLVFFSHEGDTRYITNRLWLANLNGEMYNIVPQRLDKNGNLIDCFGHECWAADGKGLYFVKYLCSPEGPRGIGYVDVESKEFGIKYSKYDYWHVCAAPNGKYLAADAYLSYDSDFMGTGDAAVCFIDIEKNTEELLVKVKNKSHPAHPHPQFNTTCTKLCFHNLEDEETISVGIIDI